MRYSIFPNIFFSRNRALLKEKLPKNSCAIIYSNDLHSLNADSEILFKQNSNFFYLTGIEKPNTALLIFSENKPDILFIPKVGEYEKIWEGDLLTTQKATKISGINEILDVQKIQQVLINHAPDIETFLLNHNEHPRKFNANYLTIEEQKINSLKNNFPLHKFDRLGPILSKMRAIKSEEEISMIEKACKITSNAFREVLPKVKDCTYEYELEAGIIYEFTKSGCYRMAYNPIIASGENSLSLHYNANYHSYKEKNLILMDFGAEYANYSADTTRVIPVAGKFSKEESEVYDSVLDVLKLSKKYFTIGKNVEEAFQGMCEELKEKMLILGLIKEKKSKDYKKFFMHGMGHHLGLDTHDFVDRNLKIENGMVFAIEPAIYIAEKNIGIRLENNFYMKNGELVNICAEMPIEREEIEILMNNK